MKTAYRTIPYLLSIGLLLLIVSCTHEVTIRAHTDVSEVEVADYYIGDLREGQEAQVEVQGQSAIVVWKHDGNSVSDFIRSPRDDGRVWHLYSDYGTW